MKWLKVGKHNNKTVKKNVSKILKKNIFQKKFYLFSLKYS